jgi:hypothetical protein
MASRFTGILVISGAKCVLDNILLVIDDADCGGNINCTSRRARDFFVNQGTPSGSTVTVCGVLTGNPPSEVIHMFRDESQCS